jgi:hypothetical protein
MKVGYFLLATLVHSFPTLIIVPNAYQIEVNLYGTLVQEVIYLKGVMSADGDSVEIVKQYVFKNEIKKVGS